MQPYSPYYYQPTMNYNQMMNTQQRLAQMEQQYPQYAPQSLFQTGLTGKVVEDFNSITANDVPMDNSGAIFVKRDNSEIQIRVWGNDGLIRITSYKPILDNLNDKTSISSHEQEKLKFDLSDEATEGIMKRFDALENLISGKKGKKNAKSNADDIPTNDE